MDAIAGANEAYVHAYGGDPFTRRAIASFREIFGQHVEVVFTFNGTGGNVVSLGSVCRPWESVICAESAHINSDECGAPERIAGVKLVPVATADGKLSPDLVLPYLTGFGVEHHAQPRVISVSQVSEYGTVYSVEELRALSDLAHEHNMLLHVDGARFANAVARVGCSASEMFAQGGIDVLTFGGTKNGMLFGEAVVVADGVSREVLHFVRKQSGQLASKMRYVSAQFSAMFEEGLWLRCASHANEMAARLAEGARALGIEITQAVEANEIFAILSPEVIPALSEQFGFYTWNEARREVRWVTSWSTRSEDVDELISALRDAMA
jgi:threonine aldolase